MKRLLSLIFFCLFLVTLLFVNVSKSSSDELDDLTKKINDLTTSLSQSVNATKPLQSQLITMQNQIINIKQQIAGIEQDIAVKKKNIDNEYKHLAKEQDLLNRAIRDYYMKSYSNTPLITLLSAGSATEITQALAYQKATADQDKEIITNLALSITDLEQKKKDLEDEESRLAIAKTNLDAQSAKLDTIVQGAKAYQATLTSQIAQLTQQQQQLLAAKLASLGLPTSAYTTSSGCVDDRTIDPGFSPRFAMFTYGVPNRIGLNQYGAWGRAKAGETAEQILQDYYPGLTLKKDYDKNASINVNGNGSMSIEEYVKRIYEMPSSWTDNESAALKAQAVAARSYGLAHKGGICTTDSCQVFKPDPKTDNGGSWIAAASDTAGWVLVDGGGNPASTQYSSTHGGYIINISKFDGSGGNPSSFADLNSRAYDKMSPWFYCDWGSRASYNKTAWLQSSEFADIVNVMLLAQKDSSTQPHLSQTDKSIPDTWSADQVKQELKNRGGTPFNSVSDVSVSADFGSGRTTTVNVSGDGGSVSFSGSDFKTYFNLRAPANINIVGPLYNVEKK